VTAGGPEQLGGGGGDDGNRGYAGEVDLVLVVSAGAAGVEGTFWLSASTDDGADAAVSAHGDGDGDGDGGGEDSEGQDEADGVPSGEVVSQNG
jgi:hypothetical protein